MIRIVIFSLFLTVTSVAWGQEQMQKDPAYYKHPNRTVRGGERSIIRPASLASVYVTQNSTYKHPLSNRIPEKQHGIVTTKKEKRSGTYKHPFGLGR